MGDECQAHASSTIWRSDERFGDHPRTVCARPALATRDAGSPSRRGPYLTSKLTPVTARHVAITSATE
jgi:hypothetical protein